jgi:DNA-3-methyladenine glycosylase
LLPNTNGDRIAQNSIQNLPKQNVEVPVKLARSFYEQKTIGVARQLIGKYLVREHADGTTAGKIVETEAYVGPEDKACHASRGRTARTDVMFGAAGHAYVYFIYGFHNMLNIVTEAEGFPAAVLIRAVEPIEGIPLMESRRHRTNVHQLASGPGKLCDAFAIDRSLNGIDVCGSILYLEDRKEPLAKIVSRPRIGVDYAGKWKNKPFRFLIAGNRFVSKP